MKPEPPQGWRELFFSLSRRKGIELNNNRRSQAAVFDNEGIQGKSTHCRCLNIIVLGVWAEHRGVESDSVVTFFKLRYGIKTGTAQQVFEVGGREGRAKLDEFFFGGGGGGRMLGNINLISPK